MTASGQGEQQANDRPYHHGHLAEALLAAAVARARSGGPAAVGLREVTRDVGVTPRAAYRHYADRAALVVAVARVALAAMRDEMVRRLDLLPADDQADRLAARRLQAIGEGYVAAALAEPGLFETALFGLADLAETRSAEGEPPTPYELLQGAIADLVAVGCVAPGQADVVAATCWSTVHGFATLATQGPLRELPAEAALRLGLGVVATVTVAVTGVAVSAPTPGAPPA